MKFSFIIPVYNTEEYVIRCLESIKKQSCTDFEVIVVNDGSTDNSKWLVQQYIQELDGWRLINQNNKGLGGARNTGIEHARGEYLIFLDSDDYITDDMLAIADTYTEKYDLDIFIFEWIQLLDSEDYHKKVNEIKYDGKYREINQKDFFMEGNSACGKVFRRKLFFESGILFPEHMWYEDLATIYKTVIYANKIGVLNKALYCYTQRPGSITHTTYSARMLEIKEAFEMNVDYFKDHNCYCKFKNELEWICVLYVIYFSAFRLLNNGLHLKDMNFLYDYCKQNFPDFLKNQYVLEQIDKRYMMRTIINHHFICFYFKNVFDKIIEKCSKIVRR